MKKILTILAILLAFGAVASAQTPSMPVSIYAGGALSIPTAPESFKTAFKNGFHGSLGVGFDVNPMFELVGKVEYHAFKFDFDPAYSDYSGGTNKMLMFGGDLKFNPSVPAMPVKPYLLGGVGFANIKQSEFSGPSSLSLSILNALISEDQTKFYWNAGAGFTLVTSPVFSLFAQARYVSIATDYETSSFIPITVGLKFF
jgi:opacity protein-like surface antigen